MQLNCKIWHLCASWLAIIACLILCSCSHGKMRNDVIVENDDYIITVDSVVFGQWMATAPDAQHLFTNYESVAIDSIPNIVKVRLAVCGRDNELLPASYHYVDLDSWNSKSTIKAFTPDSIKLKSSHNVAIPKQLELQIDMSELHSSLNEYGWFVTPNQDTIYKQDYEQSGAWIIVDLDRLGLEKIKIEDSVNNGDIVSVNIQPNAIKSKKSHSWSMEHDFNGPHYKSEQTIVDAIYNMSMTELEKSTPDLQPAIVAQECYAIALSLAFLKPQESIQLLQKMVKDSVIHVESTSTTPSYTSLVNDMIWADAAWSVYCATGDKKWVMRAFSVISNSINQVKGVMSNHETNLFHAITPYYNYSHQYYPHWMTTSDAIETIPLVGNAIMEHAYRLLGQIADEFDAESAPFYTQADHLKDAINHRLWNETKGCYTQYLYGGIINMISPCVDNLGQSLAILWDIADDDRAETLINETPVTSFGVPLLYPNRENVETGLHNTISPMVQALWNLAAAKTGNMSMLRRGMGALIYQQALAASCAVTCNATTGELLGSNNSLANAAGNAAMILRVLAGMNFLPNGIEFNPKVPVCFDGKKVIIGFSYRNATLDITVKGTGDELSKITLDGKALDDNFISDDITGKHSIVITMNNEHIGSGKTTLAQKTRALPQEPQWMWNGFYGTNYTYSDNLGYKILINGESTYSMRDSVMGTRDTVTFRTYSIVAINKYGHSYIAKPHDILTLAHHYNLVEYAPHFAVSTESPSSYSHHPINIVADTTKIEIPLKVNDAGAYVIDLLYANGNGPQSFLSPSDFIMVEANGHPQGAIATPQLGSGIWLAMTYSSRLKIKLLKGQNTISLKYILLGSAPTSTRKILVDQLRIIKVSTFD